MGNDTGIQYHFVVVFDVDTNSYYVVEDMGFDYETPIWDGSDWQPIETDQQLEINNNAAAQLSKLIGENV